MNVARKFSGNVGGSSGFTLAEVTISMAVLSVALAVLIGMLVTSIRLNKANIHEFVAYGLAQEGLEAMRNIRDSNWLSNFEWTGHKAESQAAQSPTSYFGSDMSGLGCFQDIMTPNTYFYRVSYNVDYSLSTEPPDYNPWRLKCLTDSLDPRTEYTDETNLLVFSDDGRDVYVHDIDHCCSSGEATRYYRYIEVVIDPVDRSRAKITSVVKWREHGRPSSVIFDMVLTDWKGGPI